MPSAAQNRAGLGKWEPGVVDEIGDAPTIRAECGDVVRFAYRNVKRMGKPKRIVNVGDRVEFIRPLVCEPGNTPKAVHVRLIELMEEPLPPSQFEASYTLSKSLQPWVLPSAQSSSDVSDDGSSVGGTDSSSSSVATCCSPSTEWRRHDPYSWEGAWTMTTPPTESP